MIETSSPGKKKSGIEWHWIHLFAFNGLILIPIASCKIVEKYNQHLQVMFMGFIS